VTTLLQAWSAIRGGPQQSSVWALSTPITNGNRAQAHAALLDFARALPTGPAGDLHGADAALTTAEGVQ
jgi:hypothetical protein